ncbi:MAG: TonB-dependent receptor [Proteobacteria bacterium]|nr:TonB-dependent receptor [Pseudomonadota bacterium]
MSLAGASPLCLFIAPLACPAETAPATLEEVIVTAQRREQKLQDVPIAVQVMSADQIQKVAAENLAQMDRYVPGLVVSGDSPTQPHYQLRGIGASDFGVGTDPAVGVYVDGVYAARSGASFLAFNDIERIEVLRGPQGTLFGRSSAAGAISIVTRKPSDTLEGSVDLRFGNEGKRRAEGMFNLPLAAGVALRLNAVGNEADGFLRDAATGRKLDPERNWATRAALRWDIDAATQALLAWNHDAVNQLARVAIGLIPVPAAGTLPPPVTPATDGSTWLDPLRAPIYNDVVGNRESRRLDEVVLQFSHRFGDVEFRSTTDWRQFATINREDEDGTNRIATYFDTANVEHNANWYQEFKLSGRSSRVDWVAGVSYSSEHAQQHSDTDLYTDGADTVLSNLGLAPPGGLFGLTSAAVAPLLPSLLGLPWRETMYDDGRFKSLGVFGDVIWHLTDKLNLTTGLRYSRDKKDFAWTSPYRQSPELDALLDVYNQNGVFMAPGLPPLQAYQFNLIFGYGQTPGSAYGYATSSSWSDLSPRLVLDYKIDPDTLVYVSATKGFTPGGFDSVQINGRYDKETVWNYEAGLKASLPQAHLVVDAAAYFYQYKNKQSLVLATLSGGVPEYVVDSSDQKAHGLDLEVHWQPVASLSLGLAAAYIDATFQKYISQYGTNLAGEPTGEPRLSFTVNGDYSIVLSGGSSVDLFLGSSYRGATRCNADALANKVCLPAANFSLGGSQTITDARIGWRSADGRWRASLYATNLFDKRYVTGINQITAATFGTPIASVNAPRRYGVDLHAAF